MLLVERLAAIALSARRSGISRGFFQPGRCRRGAVSRGRKIVGAIVMVVTVTCLALVQTHFFSTYKVISESMEPTLMVGDCILEMRTRDFKREDVVVLLEPDDPSTIVVKRLIGLPGDNVEIKRGHIWINGEPNRNYEYHDPRYALPKDNIYTLGKDEFFVAGDNRVLSRDSRYFGPVPRDLMQGKMLLRYYMVKPGSEEAVAEEAAAEP